jgi:copper chaperone
MDSGMETIGIRIRKMKNCYCITAVLEKLAELRQVYVLSVLPGLLLLKYDKRVQSDGQLGNAIEQLGYKIEIVKNLSIIQILQAMETAKFKTNIKCSGCVAKVTPFLNETVGEDNWEVDVNNPEKILTVVKDGISEADVIKAVQEAGFKAEEA